VDSSIDALNLEGTMADLNSMLARTVADHGERPVRKPGSIGTPIAGVHMRGREVQSPRGAR
jgi:hypothetical protein